MAKQAVDLHSSRLSQRIVLEANSDAGWAARLESLADFYRQRRDLFATALDRHFGGLARWEVPRGGLFFWLTLNREIDTRELLAGAIDRGVAFILGEEFYAGPPRLGTLRLNFSHANADDADRGLGVLAELVRESSARPSSRCIAVNGTCLSFWLDLMSSFFVFVEYLAASRLSASRHITPARPVVRC